MIAASRSVGVNDRQSRGRFVSYRRSAIVSEVLYCRLAAQLTSTLSSTVVERLSPIFLSVALVPEKDADEFAYL